MLFRVKTFVGVLPQLELLVVFSHTSQDTTCHNNATTYAHIGSMSTQFHSGMGTQTQTVDCALVFLSVQPSSFGAVPNNLASHAHEY